MTQPLEILEQMKTALDDAYAAGVRNTKREWVGLSVFEINDLVENTEFDDYHGLVEATEKLLKEKNT